MNDEPRARSDLTVVELDGEAVVYDGRTATLHHLNAAATLVFLSLDGTVGVKTLAGELAESTGVPAEELEQQVGDVVSTFEEAGLLEVAGG